jgi:hypothetical protein
MLASFENMGYIIFGVAAVQMLPDLCSSKSGFSVQVHWNTHLDTFFAGKGPPLSTVVIFRGNSPVKTTLLYCQWHLPGTGK